MQKLSLLTEIADYVTDGKLIVQPSNSLLHVPVTKLSEPDLDEVILGGLSFADQKLDEIAILTKALTDGAESVTAELEDARAAVTALNESSHRNNLEVQEAIANLGNVRVDRELPFAERIKLQHAWLNLPLFPTTTIGSSHNRRKCGRLGLIG